MSQWRAIVLAVSLASLLGCNTFRFEVSKEPHEQTPVEDRKTFWVAALFPTLEVDVRAICPAGVGVIEESTTFTDGLFRALTIGVYSPRTSDYYCLIPQQPPATASAPATPPAPPAPPAPGGTTP